MKYFKLAQANPLDEAIAGFLNKKQEPISGVEVDDDRPEADRSAELPHTRLTSRRRRRRKVKPHFSLGSMSGLNES